jgi:hypothetical protein
VTRPRARQEALDLGAAGHRRAGRVETRTAAAIRAAKAEDKLGKLDDGVCALAVELARAVDVGALKQDPYAIATAGRELREVMSRLKLDPTSRGLRPDDPLSDFLAGLGSPTVGDTADPVAP